MASTETNLWRAVRREAFPEGPTVGEDPRDGVLEPTFYATPYTVKVKGKLQQRLRQPDVTITLVDGEEQVETGGGTSLFDRAGVFKYDNWFYFSIPAGTIVPDSLVVLFTHYNEQFAANHYQIEVRAGTMTIDAFKGALNNLARNATVRARELAGVALAD